MLSKRMLIARKQGIGGSEVAAILNVSPWKTILDVYNDKITPSVEESDPFNSDIDQKYIGSVLEESIAQMFAKKNNITFLSNEEIKQQLADVCDFQDIEDALLIKSKNKPWMIANIDRAYIGHDGKLAILECKNSGGHRKEWGEEESSDIPAYYKAQVAWYRMITGVETVDLAVLMNGNIFKTYKYEKLDYLEKKITQVTSDFWNNNILKRVPPTTLRTFGASVNAKDVAVVSQENMNFIRTLKDKKHVLKLLEKEVEDMESELKYMLGDATLAVDDHDNKILSYNIISTNRFDVRILRDIDESMYERCKKPSTYRVLKFFKQKELENE